MQTHEDFIAAMLTDSAVRAESERIGREETLMLDAILKGRTEAGLTQAQVTEPISTQASTVARLENAWCLHSSISTPNEGNVAVFIVSDLISLNGLRSPMFYQEISELQN